MKLEFYLYFEMYRRDMVKAVGASITSLSVLPAAGSGAQQTDEGVRPVGGDVPNENVPRATITPFMPEGDTREVGQFITLHGGWKVGEEQTFEAMTELVNKTRQTFTYGDQSFVLDSEEDWERDGYGENTYKFSHTKPPYPKGDLIEVTWDAIFTDSYYDSWREMQYEPGDRYMPWVFPLSETFEIVGKNRGKR
ncbi:hypothetical protein [Halorussus salinisoli]|uniref:hypothetical protein n=1 Tax=Halorussus salinisoli TaxID=2558242 RepID=UPI0010C1AEBA|nr:hypothetical protein [Halorussus salinisoli]